MRNALGNISAVSASEPLQLLDQRREVRVKLGEPREPVLAQRLLQSLLKLGFKHLATRLALAARVVRRRCVAEPIS